MPLFQCQKCGAVENTARAIIGHHCVMAEYQNVLSVRLAPGAGNFARKTLLLKATSLTENTFTGRLKAEEKDGIFIWSYNKSFVMKGKVEPHDPLNPKALPKPTEESPKEMTSTILTYEPPFRHPSPKNQLGATAKEGEPFTDQAGRTYIKQNGTIRRIKSARNTTT